MSEHGNRFIVHIRLLACMAALAGFVVAGGGGDFALAQQSGPDLAWSAVLPGDLDSVRADAGDLPRYVLTATLEPGERRLPATIKGRLALTLPAIESGQTTIPLRLYPNDGGYAEGGMTLDSVSVDGIAVSPAYSAGQTSALVPLSGAALDDGPVLLEAEFTTTVPVHSRHGFGMFSVKPEVGVTALAHWYPMLAGPTAAGPDLAPPSQIGDPVFSVPALFDVTLTAPAGEQVVVGGVVLERSESGEQQVVRFVTGPAREAPIFIGSDWTALTVPAGDVTITVWASPAHASHAPKIADWATAAITIFGERFGSYPYRELDVVISSLYGAAGMEFPGVVIISPSILSSTESERAFAEMVVVHEVAHQWWYAMVLNDQNLEAFIDEGLSEYAATEIYFSDRYSPEEGRRQFALQVEDWMAAQLAGGGDLVVDQPTEAFPDRPAYAAAVYAKASLGLDAIRAQIGDEAFFAALGELSRARRFDVISGEDLKAAFVAACACDIEAVWTMWFDEKRLGEDPAAVGTPAPSP
jgi:hypothetical protein